MSRFLGDLVVREVDEIGGLFELQQPLGFESDVLGKIVAVPEGFITDFASVPRLPFAFMVVGGKGNKAAVIHDFLYTVQQCTREQADGVFAEALRTTGYPASVVNLMWAGVRLGGGSHWTAPNVPQDADVQAQIVAGSLIAP